MNVTQKNVPVAADPTSSRPASVVWLQHVPFEGAGAIAAWMQERGHQFRRVALWNGDPLPPVDTIDWLIVMGGPMNVDEVDQHAWLLPERRLIQQCLAAEVPVLGICLGAQLIARALSAEVRPGSAEEIGWFALDCTPAGEDLLGAPTPEVFHWHGDQCALPSGATRLASTPVCQNQGFLYGSAVALQFHLETTLASAQDLIEHCDWQPSDTAQSAADMLRQPERFERLNAMLWRVLDWQDARRMA